MCKRGIKPESRPDVLPEDRDSITALVSNVVHSSWQSPEELPTAIVRLRIIAREIQLAAAMVESAQRRIANRSASTIYRERSGT